MSRDDEQVWADLVEAFHASPDDDEARWPAAEDVTADGRDDGTVDTARPTAEPVPAAADDDHFVPPPPPPLPRGDVVSRLAWSAVLGAPVFLVLAVALGWELPSVVTGLGVGAFVGGFVTLIARMRGRNPHDPDDGAVV
ncbi:MAG TPA: hypothetical protein VFI46_10255 [Jiangellaceae bacterium]|nr:hypothetical protein [Jiangellaceae bacterium]